MGMEPVSSNIKSKTCANPISSDCVTSNVPSIPCIGVCAGASMTDVEFAIGNSLCNLITQLQTLENVPAPVTPVIDFSKLNFGCLYSPTITVWTCPVGQTFIPDSTAFAYNGTAGFCQICPTPPSPLNCQLTHSTPTAITTANPTPPPTTLLGVLQLIINAIPCCNPCSGVKVGP